MRTAIPASFKLGGRTWKVKFVDIIDNDPDVLGYCQTHLSLITIKGGQSKQDTESVFFHELTHAIFETLGWEKLSKDEGKVDALGSMVHQFLQTKTGRLL